MRYAKAVILVLLSMLASVTYAQTDSVQAKIPLMINTENSKSLEFQPWQDVSISYKHQLTQHAALRHTLEISLSLSNENNDEDYTNRDVAGYNYSRSTSYRHNYQRIVFSSQYLIYPFTFSSAQIFTGGGPSFHFNRSYNFSDYSSQFTSEYTQYTYGIGAIGTAGIECFLNNRCSFLIQYQVSASYDWTNAEDIHRSQTGSFENSTMYKAYSRSLRLNSIRLGIAYYF